MAETETEKENLTGRARSMANLKRITKENAPQYVMSAVAAKKARAEMRRKLLQVVIDEGLEKYLAKAIKSGDPDMLGIVEKASKLTGIDFASSEEAVQRMDVKADANIKGKHDMTLNLTFSEAKPKE